MSIRYISQKLAQQIDEELMSSAGAFSLDQSGLTVLYQQDKARPQPHADPQLMELAGLSCAQALARSFPLHTHPRVLVCCGPGNQGGDGLVAARHLHHLGYTPTVFLPKPGNKDIYQRLLRQCENVGLGVLREVELLERALGECDVVMDAVFGFSFHPPLRRPFDRILTLLGASRRPIISIDIPSGWDVERGQQRLEVEPGSGTGAEASVVDTFAPEVLVSLTAPKMGVKEFKGRHWLGGRFVPDELARKHELNLPPYEGLDQVVELSQ